MQTTRQGTWAERANRLFPQGSNGEFDFPDGLTPVFERANGCHVWDNPMLTRIYVSLAHQPADVDRYTTALAEEVRSVTAARPAVLSR